ncbi:MAG: PDZ domain-containing protein, partial [Bacteroidales bacterium]|nr:PDZ domain-containing protein [Bacteroidales bacterium]
MKLFKKISVFIVAIAMIFIGNIYSQNDARMLRFPDINKDRIVFVYAGDIWTVSATGGDAKRLTSHKGMELFPKLSPDGKWIAFSAEYSGNRQVYIIPAKGGKSKQLTYYNDVGNMPPRGGWDYVVLDWTPDSKNILVRANRTPFGKRVGKYYFVNINGGLEKPLQIPEGGFGSLSPDGKKLCYTPIGREFRTWKRYKGGRASDVWIYDLEKDAAEQITNFKGSDQIPYWYKDKIYFASDRDLRLNMYSYDVDSKKTEQLTKHTDFDVMWPSGDGGSLVYELGGYIYKLNLEIGTNEKVSVNINFDNPNVIPYFKNVSENINDFDISPSGKRAVFEARGDIFSLPAKDGVTYNLTNTQGIREINPSWSPDGKHIIYYSDKTGEYELYLLKNERAGKAVQITKNSTALKYGGRWSPNSKKFLYFDRNQELRLLDVDTKKETMIDKSTQDEIFDYTFSGDSKWISYSKSSDNRNNTIWVYNIDSKKKFEITDNMFNSFSPEFSKDGNYIFFISTRNFNLAFSSFEFNYVYNKAAKIYAVALQKSTPKLFEYENDIEEGDTKKDDKKEGEEKNKSIKIDKDRISDRIVALPVPSGNYFGLATIDEGVLYVSDKGIHTFQIKDKKDEKIIEGVFGFSLSPDGKKMLYRKNGSYHIDNVSPGLKPGKGKLNTDDMVMKIDPRKEWQQIYVDGWRIFRDWFYAKNIHNVDWVGIKDKYAKLVPYVSHRSDLDYILGEMIGESNTGHCYVNYGDFPKVERIETGLLGAELTADNKAGRYKITKIFKGENWYKKRRSPLTEQGISINEGDYLISINGHDITTKDNPYMYLENTVGKIVTIKVNSKASAADAKTYEIKPIASEQQLRYLDWVESRRAMVDKLSNGKIGYIHVPNTAVDGNEELHRGMYAYH